MNEKIVDKIIKCLQMSESAGYNKHEADNALRLAKKLCDENDLDFATVEAVRQNKKADEIKYDVKLKSDVIRRFYPWEQALMASVDKLIGVRHFYNDWGGSKKQLVIIGAVSDVAVAIQVFHLLRKMGERYSREAYGPRWSRDHLSFVHGFAVSLFNRADALAEQS